MSSLVAYKFGSLKQWLSDELLATLPMCIVSACTHTVFGPVLFTNPFCVSTILHIAVNTRRIQIIETSLDKKKIKIQLI